MNLPAQQPDYAIDSWVGPDFRSRARPFFATLTLQTALGGIPSPSSTHRMAVGILLAGGGHGGVPDLSLGGGKPGIIPALYGHYRVTSNLALNGLYSGFLSRGDVVILTRYGLNLKLSPGKERTWTWMLHVLMGTLQGPDDFFLKTVDAGVSRRINYRGWEGWAGFGLNTFAAGIHVHNVDPGLNLNTRMEGEINSIFFGVRRRVGPDLEGSLEGSVGPSVLGIAIGVHKLIG